MQRWNRYTSKFGKDLDNWPDSLLSQRFKKKISLGSQGACNRCLHEQAWVTPETAPPPPPTSSSADLLVQGPGRNLGPDATQFKHRASSTPSLAWCLPAHTAPSTRPFVVPAAPTAQAAFCGPGTAAPLPTPRQVGGRWRHEGPASAHVAVAGGGRKPAIAAPRARYEGGMRAGQGQQRRRAASPRGGRRDPGSGGGGEAGAIRPRRAGPAWGELRGGGEASERILVARFSGWWCPGTGTPSAAAGFAEVLARQVSTHTPSWFAANKARHRKRRSKCYSPCTGPRASRANQPRSPRQNDPCAPQTPRTCLGCPEGSLERRNPGETFLAARPPTSAAAAAAERREPTRLSHREFAIWPLVPLKGAPWVLVPRSFRQPNPPLVSSRLLLF